jgi:hypothetical protein
VLDHGIASAVVGYTDALVATMLDQTGVPAQGSAGDSDDTARWLDTLEGELAAISGAH